MARVKISIPDSFRFQTTIPIRITDINYGGHVGNDSIVSLVHEARMQYLLSLGLTELDPGGTGLIMADLAVEFKAESFYGDQIKVAVAATEFSRVGFDLIYQLSKQAGDKHVVVALVKTGMVCFDYNTKRVTSVPVNFKDKLSS